MDNFEEIFKKLDEETEELRDETTKRLKAHQESKNKKSKFIVVFILIILLLCLVVAILSLINDNSSNTKYDNLNSTCYYYSQRLVKEKLKSPKSAEFPSYSNSFVTKSGDIVTVSAYVDAQNSFGATIRTDYVATIKIKNGEPISGSVVLAE